MSRTEPFRITIFGQPQSKANSRRVAVYNGVKRFIKSKAAIAYMEDFRKQCPLLEPMFTGDVHVRIRIYYRSRRSDLDESLILDAMQGRIYNNDRQVKKKTIEWGLSPRNPRSEIEVETFAALDPEP